MGDWLKRLFAPAVTKGANEDELLAEFFAGEIGVFVDVGANEPIIGSQSYHLEQNGWSGILVEPLSEFAERLREMRSAVVYEAAAGSPEDCGKRRRLLVAGGLSTLQPAINIAIKAREERLVLVRTLDSMLKQSHIEHVDFVSIDVEGAEMDVLRGFSLDRYRPRLLLIEDDAHARDKHKYIVARGYKLVRRTNLNNWYVPAGTYFPVSFRGRWQLFRKLYLGAPLRRWKSRLRRPAKMPPSGRARFFQSPAADRARQRT